MIIGELLKVGDIGVTDGWYMVGGTVKADGVGVARRVVLIDRRTMETVASTMSHDDGSWQISVFYNLGEKNSLVVVFDDTETYNAEVADLVTQIQKTEL